MKTHKFRAPDMMAALETVQQKLGPNAVVLSTREVFDESCWKIWKRPGVEVLAAENQDLNPENSPSLDTASQECQQPHPAAGYGKSTPEIYQRPGFHQALPEPEDSPDKWPVMKQVRQKLLSEGILEPFCENLLQVCQQVIPPQVLQDRYRVENYIQELIEAEIEVMPELKIGGTGVICLIGPGGSGKTSTTAKLAALYAQSESRQTVWVSADTIRAGAISEGRAYTENLGIPFHKVYTAEEFGGIINELREDHLVLADLFDCNPRRPDQVEKLTAYLERVPVRDTYLVLPATTKTADLLRSLEAFQPAGISGLLPTKMDETETVGNIISAAWQSSLPLVYCTAGSKVVDELLPPDPETISQKVFMRRELNRQGAW